MSPVLREKETKDKNFEHEIHMERHEHRQELDNRKKEIISKINNLESKLKKHELKEGMLDKIIAMTYVEMDNLKENEFTRRGQKQAVLIKQMEALSILHDTLIKYEDMIQKYHKILIDIENNKLNSFLKVEGLKKEESKADESISDILLTLQEQLSSGMGSGTSSLNPLIDEIQNELKADNY
jgi:hypothetical protein